MTQLAIIRYRQRPHAPKVVEISADGGATWETFHTFRDGDRAKAAIQRWTRAARAGREQMQRG